MTGWSHPAFWLLTTTLAVGGTWSMHELYQKRAESRLTELALPDQVGATTAAPAPTVAAAGEGGASEGEKGPEPPVADMTPTPVQPAEAGAAPAPAAAAADPAAPAPEVTTAAEGVRPTAAQVAAVAPEAMPDPAPTIPVEAPSAAATPVDVAPTPPAATGDEAPPSVATTASRAPEPSTAAVETSPTDTAGAPSPTARLETLDPPAAEASATAGVPAAIEAATPDPAPSAPSVASPQPPATPGGTPEQASAVATVVDDAAPGDEPRAEPSQAATGRPAPTLPLDVAALQAVAPGAGPPAEAAEAAPRVDVAPLPEAPAVPPAARVAVPPTSEPTAPPKVIEAPATEVADGPPEAEPDSVAGPPAEMPLPEVLLPTTVPAPAVAVASRAEPPAAAAGEAFPDGAEPPTDAPRESLVASTIRRAIAAIFGGAEAPAPDPTPEAGAPSDETVATAPAATPDISPPTTTDDDTAGFDAAAAADQSPGGTAIVVVTPTAGEGSRSVVEAGAVAPTDVAPRAGSADAPTFDIVRVERSGRTVIAGRAQPGAEVEVRAGDQVIDRVRVNDRGEFVAVPALPLAPGDQELTLAAVHGDRAVVESEQVVVVVVPEPPPPQPPATATAEAPPPQPAPTAAAEAPPPQPATVAEASPPSEPLAVLLPRRGGGGGRILQAPGRIGSDGKLALMMVDYDQTGRVQLSGEAEPGAPVRIYVDNQVAATVTAEPSGRWTTVLDQSLAPGDYALRLDQLDPTGKPVARLETPFTRVGKPPKAGTAQVDYVIVQPGNSLWRIARRLYGRGVRYVHIYDANKGQIRDPDLIYPGQVFEVPITASTAG